MNKLITLMVLTIAFFSSLGQAYHVGDLYTAQDGTSGIVFYTFPDGSGGWAVALNDASLGCQWGTNIDVSGLTNRNPTNYQQLTEDTAGYAHTAAIRAFQNNNPAYAAGTMDFDHGWYLPTAEQLTLLYAQRVFINQSITSAGGSLLSDNCYWSSTECSATEAWVVDFGLYYSYSGAFYKRDKQLEYPVRAVITFSSFSYDLTYQWSTGATTPDITVSPTQTTTYTVTVSTPGGCSDTVEHTVVVNSGTHEVESVTACGSFYWHGTTYTASGTHTYDYINADGCPSTDTLHLTIIPMPALNHTQDTVIQAGTSATLWASGADYLYWTDSNDSLLSSGTTLTINPLTTTTYYINGQNYSAGSNNLVSNGDFEQGNVGFVSDYQALTSQYMSYGHYTITTDGYLHFLSSHLYGYNGTGQFMLVDGATTLNTVVWQQTVPVTPHTYYAFSAQVASTHHSNASGAYALLQFSVNSVQLGDIFHSPEVLNVWNPYYEVWYSGDNTSATLSILNQNTSLTGNDFGIDEITFAPLTECTVAEPIEVTVETKCDTVYEQGTACNVFIWHGDTLRLSGEYMHMTTNTSGCDSVEVLSLTVNHSTDSTLEVVVLDCSLPFLLNGESYDSAGTYTQTLTNSAGCDSLVTLVLTTTHHIDLPDNVLDADCTVPPDSNAFTMTELFSCPNVNSMSTSMVADMDGDGLPEIIACCYTNSAPWYSSGFHVINGQTGELKYTISTVQYVNSGQMVTIADVDHDGKAELFLLGNNHRLYCYNYNGGIRWTSANTMDNNYLLSAADVNNDGNAEIVCGRYIYNAQNGTLLLQGTMVETGMGFGSPHSTTPYYMYALGDMDGDGTLELCAGNTIYKMVITNNTGTAGNSWSILRQASTTSSITNKDGQTFLVDFDNDGDVDVCVIGITHSLNAAPHTINVYAWDGQTSQLIAHTPLVSNNTFSASIPYSGDLNGDGYPEIIFSVTGIGMVAYTYDPLTSTMIQMHRHFPFEETAGFTVFDFNQDGRNEIVFRGINQLCIVDGITLENLCPPVTAYSGTITEYPIVADVNADGHAEIIITRAYNDWYAGGGANGWVSVYGSQIPGTWSSARKVWNQWAYSSVNINEDMTVPQYRFDVSTTFPNGKKPFNTFLHQMPYIDSLGNLFNPVADVAINAVSASSDGNTVTLTLNCCNTGDLTLSAPYPVTVFANTYGGEVVHTATVMESLPVDSCTQIEITLTKSLLCGIQNLEALVMAVNCAGTGIAQNGGEQTECDTTNNVSSVAYTLQHFDPVELTVSACDSYEWNGTTYTENGDYTVSFPHPGGCDSVVTLHLTVTPTPEATVTATSDTICAGDEVTLQVVTAGGGDPVLHVPPVAVGDILCTDNSIVKPSAWPVAGKTAMGVVFYVDNTGEHGWAVHLQDQGASLAWGGYGTDIPSLPNHSGTDIYTDLNGYSNTQAIRAAGNAASYPAAWAVDFNNGWYLPANGQLRVLLSTIVFINATLDLLGGQQFPMDASYTYWSSTEHSANYAGYTQNNDMGGRVKWWTSKVRSVRSF